MGIFQPAADRSHKTIEPSLPQALGTHLQLGGLEHVGLMPCPRTLHVRPAGVRTHDPSVLRPTP